VVRMVVRRRLVLFGMLMALTVLGTSCGSFFKTQAPMTVSNTAGRWVHEGPNGQQTVMNLREDGTFKITDIPVEVFQFSNSLQSITQLNWTQLHDLEGTWATGWDRDSNEPYVVMDIHNVGTNMRLYSGNEKDGVELYSAFGDPDSGVWFYFTKS